MSKCSFFSLISATALSLGLTIPSGATTVTIGATAPAGYASTTFSAGNVASGPGSWNFGSGMTANITLAGSCIDPFGTGTTAYYVCATAGSTVTADFATGITGFDLLWGSPDGYNTLTFYTGLDATGIVQQFMPGTPPLVTVTPVTVAPVLFVANPGVVWKSVTFTSTFNSFEFGNVATQAFSTTPEPAGVSLVLVGLLALGGVAFRRTKSA